MKRNTLPYMFLITFLLVAVFVADSFLKTGILNRAMSLLQPVEIVATDFGKSVNLAFSNFGNIGKLQEENQELNSKLDSALQEIAILNEAKKENVSLKNELGFKATSNLSLQPAEVLSFDPSNIRDTIMLSVGSNQGVKEGQIVLSQGYLIGKVNKVYSSTSKIMLISDPLSAIPATISSGSSTGIVKGQIGNGLILEQVPQSDLVNKGDMVVTSGLGGDYPKGLIIGKIQGIQKISGSIFQNITVDPIINLNALERVMIIK